MYESPYNLVASMDDFGDYIANYSIRSYWSWVYSTCTYGGFGVSNHSVEYSTNI